MKIPSAPPLTHRLALLVLGLFVPLSSLGKPRYSYNAGLSAQIANHVGDDSGLASERLDARFQQNITFNKRWKAELGLSGWNEFIYKSRSNFYGETVAENDSYDLRLRNLFIQYQKKKFLLVVGNQQVVWGEALGLSYLDLINPRDLRNGTQGELSQIRLQTPMVNAKVMAKNLTAQFLVIPQPYFDILPSPGNDYSYPYSKILNGTSLEIRRKTDLPLSAENAEYGFRLNTFLAHWDLSLFFLNAYDRNPVYELNPASSPTKLIANELHVRTQNYGLSATNDFDGILLRLEALLTTNREFPTLNGPSLGRAKGDNPTYIVGIDLPTWQGINSTVQWSRDIVSGKPVGLLRRQDQSIVSLRLARTFFMDHEAELIGMYGTFDSGSKTQLTYMIPVSSQGEVRFGGEIFSGPSGSDLGRFEAANRIFVNFRHHLSK